MILKIHTDGGARGNPGPAASAFVVYDEAGNVQFKRGKKLGIATNNVAEYIGVLMTWEWLKENKGMGESEIQFYLDSNLVVSQLNGEFKIKNVELVKLFEEIKKMEKELGIKVSYTHVPREKNSEADILVNRTLDGFTS